MTHGPPITPHTRTCVCPTFWTQFDGHSPYCNLRHRREFLALVAKTREDFNTQDRRP